MKITTTLAYAEVDEILKLLEDEYAERVPKKVRDFFKEERDKEYMPKIDVDIPLTQQNLKRETMVLLAILNINYWCDSEEEKQFYLKELEKNEEEKNRIEEKYNVDNIFKKKNEVSTNQLDSTEETSMVKYKEKNIIQKMLERIRKFFKRSK